MQRFGRWVGISAFALVFGCQSKRDEPNAIRVAQSLCSEDCTPYACDGGTCFTECRNDTFCAPGFQCNTETLVCETGWLVITTGLTTVTTALLLGRTWAPSARVIGGLIRAATGGFPGRRPKA